MKTLHLTLKKKWFDMIASGDKLEEYREIKKYWYDRIVSKDEFTDFETFLALYTSVFSIDDSMNNFDTVTFKNGYQNNAPTMDVGLIGITIGKAKPEWSDNWQGDVFIIKLGNVISTSH